MLETPGHSKGSVCLVVGDVIFSGDTLFRCSCGRTDFLGGSMNKMMASLARLGALAGDLKVYPGHMDPAVWTGSGSGIPIYSRPWAERLRDRHETATDRS